MSARPSLPTSNLSTSAAHWLVWFGLIVATVASSTRGEDTILYRRERIPHSLMDDQIWQIRKASRKLEYFPMKRQEFEDLIQELKERTPAEATPGSGFASGEYRAHFNGTRLVEGKAKLLLRRPKEVSGPQPELATAEAASKTAISLDDCSLAIRDAAWELDPPVKPLFGSDQHDRWMLIVDHDAPLLFDWSALPRDSSRSEPVFDLSLPVATLHSMTISAPSGWRLEASRGVLEPLRIDSAEADHDLAWRLQLPGDGKTTLSFHRVESRLDAEQNTFLHEETSYTVSHGVTEVVSKWTLDVLGGPLPEMRFRIPRDLRIVSVRQDRESIPLSHSIERNQNGTESILSIRPPEAWSGKDQALVVEGVARTPLGSNQHLPRLIPAVGQWQDGLRAVRFDETLAIRRFAATDGLQTAITVNAPSPEGSATGTRMVQCFAPTTDIVYWADPRTAKPHLDLTTVVRLSNEQWTAQSIVAWAMPATNSGSTEEIIDLRLRTPWAIDSIRSEPEDALEDWERVDSAGGGSAIRLRWRRGTEGRPRTLTIQSRRVGAADDVLGQDALVPIHEGGQGVASAYVVVVADTGFGALRWVSGENARRVEVASAPDAIRKLLDSGSAVSSTMILATQSPADFRIVRLPVTSRFSAQVALEGRFEDLVWRQSAEIRVVPEGSGMERLLVQATPSTGGKIDWTLIGGGDLQARVVDSGSATPDAEFWELTLASRSEVPFVVRGEWSGRATKIAQDGEAVHGGVAKASIRPPLLSCPQAATQTATASILEPLGHSIAIADTASGILPEIDLPGGLDNAGLRRRLFRYEPSASPSWSVSVDDDSQRWQPILRHAELHVWSTGEPMVRNVLACEIEPRGDAPFVVTLPPGAKCENILLDDRWLPNETVVDQGRIEIPLAQSQRRVFLAIVFRSLDQIGTRIVPQQELWPAFASQVLRRDLEVHWPPSRDVQVWSRRPWEYDWTADRIGQSLVGVLWHNPIGLPNNSAPKQAKEGVWPDSIRELLTIDRISPTNSPRYADLASDETWHRLRRNGTDAMEPCLIVMDRGLRFAGLAILFLGAVLTTRWFASRGFKTLALIAVAASTLSFVFESVFPGTGFLIFWGACFGAGWGLLGGISPDVDTATNVHRPVVIPMIARSGAVIVALLATLAAYGQVPGPAKETNIFVVFDPIDEEGKPYEDVVQVPLQLERLLRSRAKQPKSTEIPWLLVGAKYRLRVEGNELREMVSLFELETFQDRTEVRIPLTRKEWLLAPDAVRVNGQRVVPSWDESGTHLQLTAPAKGLLRLEIVSKPLTVVKGDSVGLTLSIPPCPLTEVHVSAPLRELSQVYRDNRSAELYADREGPVAVFRFARSSRLDLHWTRSSTAGRKSYDQLTLLDVRPGSCRLQTQWLVKAIDIPFKEVRIRYDGNLAWLPRTKVDEGATAELDRATKTLVWRFDRPMTEAVITASWLIPKARGTGNVVMPPFTIEQGQMTRFWTGVRVPAHVDARPSRDSTSVAPDVFAKAWKVDSPSLDAAYDLGDVVGTTTFVVSRRSPNTSQSIRTRMELTRLATRLRWEATLSNLGPGVFQHELAVPVGFVLQSARVIEGSAERPSKFFPVEPGRATLQLTTSAGGTQRLLIEGWVPPGSEAPVGLPRIRALGSNVIAERVEITRSPKVIAKMGLISGYREIDQNNVDRILDDTGLRQVATYAYEFDIDGPMIDQPLIQAVVSQNRADAEAKGKLSVSPEGARWNASLELDVKAVNDPLEEIAFETASTWQGPFVTEPPARIVRETIGDERRQRIRVIFERPLKGEGKWRITGPLVTPSGDVFSVPATSIVGVPAASLEVVLPLQSRGRKIDWNLSGLQVPPTESGTELLCRVVSPDFVAKIRSSDEREPQLIAPCTIASMTPIDSRNMLVVTALLLQPDRRREVFIELPAGVEPLGVHLNSMAAPAVMDGQRLRVLFDSPWLAQTLVVRYVVPRSANPSDVVARISGAESAFTYVRLGKRLNADAKLVSVPETRVAQRWLAAISGSIATASDRAVNQGGNMELATWAGWLALELDAVEPARRNTSTSSDGIKAATVGEIVAERMQIEQALQTLVSNARPVAVVDSPIWSIVSDTPEERPTWYQVLPSENQAETIPISWAQRVSSATLFWPVWGIVALLMLAVGRTTFFARVVQRWPLGMLALGGLLLTIVIQPSAIGWGIAAVAALAGLRSSLSSARWAIHRGRPAQPIVGGR
jgi:hypothetical protein